MEMQETTRLDLSQFKNYTTEPWNVLINNAYNISYIIRGGKLQNKIAQVFNWQDQGMDCNAEENANLIAAAPLLLKECLLLREELDRMIASEVLRKQTLESLWEE